MKAMFLVFLVGLGYGHNAAADVCDDAMDYVKKGFEVTLDVSTQRIDQAYPSKLKKVAFNIYPHVIQCSDSSEGEARVTLKRTFVAKILGKDYVGAFDPNSYQMTQFSYQPGRYVNKMRFVESGSLSFHSSVIARIAGEFEVDSYEAPYADPYVLVTLLHGKNIPHKGWKMARLVGLAGKRGHLFQLEVTNSSIRPIEP